jgi:hypothetical protein
LLKISVCVSAGSYGDASKARDHPSFQTLLEKYE